MPQPVSVIHLVIAMDAGLYTIDPRSQILKVAANLIFIHRIPLSNDYARSEYVNKTSQMKFCGEVAHLASKMRL